MRRFGLYAALALCIYGLPATAEERFERWSLERPGDFIFALSFKRSISFDDRTATSELAFVCNQEEKYVAVLLIPLDGTFKSRQNSGSEDRRDARCERRERVDAACCSSVSRIRRCRRQTISTPEYVALAQKMHRSRSSFWP